MFSSDTFFKIYPPTSLSRTVHVCTVACPSTVGGGGGGGIYTTIPLKMLFSGPVLNTKME